MQIDNNQLLRFTTAGSVDDGKSTLIGRLLYDSKSIFEDQLNSIENISKNKGLDKIDLALFTDGLREEREQGITIDVAYQYFTTSKRKFIIADTPGHIQYTRNMVTGASTANVAVVLIDARKGVVEQTKRHSYIASLLQISHIIVCVNKMDLVAFDETIFNDIVDCYEEISSEMTFKDIRYIPISALKGDNVVHKSKHMPWYHNTPLLDTLETIHIDNDTNKINGRFPIQTVIRPQARDFEDFRGYAGRISSGIFRVGDTVKILPSGLTSIIDSIQRYDISFNEAYANMSVTITLKDNIDINRGDMIVKLNNTPIITQDITAMICWLHDSNANPRTTYIIKHTTNKQKAIIKNIHYKLDINNLQQNESDKNLLRNDIAKIQLKTTQPLMIDSYKDNRTTGSFILIDPVTNDTVAAGMII